MEVDKKVLSGVTDRQVKLTLEASNTEKPVQLGNFQLVIKLASTTKTTAISYTPLLNTASNVKHKINEADGTYQQPLIAFLGLQEDATLAGNDKQEIWIELHPGATDRNMTVTFSLQDESGNPVGNEEAVTWTKPLPAVRIALLDPTKTTFVNGTDTQVTVCIITDQDLSAEDLQSLN